MRSYVRKTIRHLDPQVYLGFCLHVVRLADTACRAFKEGLGVQSASIFSLLGERLGCLFEASLNL